MNEVESREPGGLQLPRERTLTEARRHVREEIQERLLTRKAPSLFPQQSCWSPRTLQSCCGHISVPLKKPSPGSSHTWAEASLVLFKTRHTRDGKGEAVLLR